MKKEINTKYKEQCIAALREKGFQFSPSTIEIDVDVETFMLSKYDTISMLDTMKQPGTRITLSVLLRHPNIHGDNEWSATKLKLGLNFDRQQVRNWEHANSDEVVEKFIKYVKMRTQTLIERGTLQHLAPKRNPEAALH